MTKEEKIAKMTSLRTEVEGKVKLYNEAAIAGNMAEMSRLDNEITEAVGEHSSLARSVCFDECKATPDPMLEAVKRLSYQTIRAKDVNTGEGNVKQFIRQVEDIDRQIDLLKLHKYIEGGIGHDKNWNHFVEKFNFLMTAQKAVDLGIDPKVVNDSYAMSEISKQLDMGKTPTSKTNILKTLTSVIQSMIGEEYKPTSHDVNFLMSVYSKKSKKALTVSCANHKYMRGYLMEICNRVVTGGAYGIEFKAVKQ